MKVKKSDIEEQFTGCPYCGTPGDVENGRACCGEIHFTELVRIKGDDTAYELEGVEIIEDLPISVEIFNEMMAHFNLKKN